MLSNLSLFQLKSQSHTHRFVDWLVAARGDKVHGGDLETAGRREAGGRCQELAARLTWRLGFIQVRRERGRGSQPGVASLFALQNSAMHCSDFWHTAEDSQEEYFSSFKEKKEYCLLMLCTRYLSVWFEVRTLFWAFLLGLKMLFVCYLKTKMLTVTAWMNEWKKELECK